MSLRRFPTCIRAGRPPLWRLHTLVPLVGIVAILLAATARAQDEAPKVVLVTTDGLRWEEVFRGADPALMNKENGGVQDVPALTKAFGGETIEERRARLLPFFWSELAKNGQLYGNRDAGSEAVVTNGRNFSYPGYNELLTGRPDERVDSNAKKPNANVTVLEWLARRPAYRGQVAAFASWDVLPYIINEERAGVPVNGGWERIEGEDLTDRERLLNDLMVETFPVWENSRLDSLTFEPALEHMRARHPRVLYISLGETDEFAHEGRYDHYLNAAHRFDAMLARLWAAIQADPFYRGKTSLVVTTDHGRGGPPQDWRHHGAKIAGAEYIWIGVLGPRTPALGVRKDIPRVTQSQVAATVAALLGEDYNAEVSEVAPPIAEAVKP